MNRRSLLKMAATAPLAGLPLKTGGEAHFWTGEEFRRVIGFNRQGHHAVVAYMSPETLADLCWDRDFLNGFVWNDEPSSDPRYLGSILGVKIIEIFGIPRGVIDWVWA